MAWHCRTRGDLWLSLLLPFVQHTLLFPPGLIHSGRVRRLVEVAFFDLHVRWLGGADCYTPTNWQPARQKRNVQTVKCVNCDMIKLDRLLPSNVNKDSRMG